MRRADQLRADAGLEGLSTIDRASAFTPAVHLRPSNAWPLTFMASLLDAERMADDHEVVVVVASSTGWYSALAASGALGFDDAFRLVQEMATAAEEPLEDDAPPAELVYPLTDDAWDADEARSTAIDQALAGAGSSAARALELGSFSRGGRHGRRDRSCRRRAAAGERGWAGLSAPPVGRGRVAHAPAVGLGIGGR